MSKKVILAAFVIVLMAVGSVIVWTVPELNWRARVVAMKASGAINDLDWTELLGMIRPGSGVYLESIAESGNPYSVIRNPYTSPEDIARGKQLYRERCAACHGAEGAGDSAPPLNTGTLKHGNSDWWLYRAITRGIAGTEMAAQKLAKTEAWQVVGFVRSTEDIYRGSDRTAGTQKTAYALPPVTSERLLHARSEPKNWITYSGDYDGKRYSLLDQINTNNAQHIELKWMFQTGAGDGFFEASPIINEDLMFVSEPPGSVHALEAATGNPVWRFDRAAPADVPLCCGQVNRGVAVAGSRVFWGTLDAHLIALDAKTGEKVWDSVIQDYRDGYSITSAPLVVKDMVLIGVGGGEYGIRGFLDAYDIDTGERIWRFYTIPEDGKPGNETWAGESWKTGGAPTWLSGSYDPEANLLYWGTGNPGPLYQGDYRSGDNLYSDCVIALNPDTGELEWHFQFTPHDEHDWDSNQIPVLVDGEWKGEIRALMLWANRNGFFYVLDRLTGEFLAATAYAEQNWAKKIDDDGRPVVIESARPTPQGAVVFPAPQGASNWQSPTYSPRTELMYVPAIDGGRIIFKQKDEVAHVPGAPFHGSMHQLISKDRPFLTTVRAIDPATGEIVWEHRNPRRNIHWKTGGLISTAGDIVFGGDMRDLFVLDARTGRELWRMNVGGYVNAVPVSFAVDGQQRLTVAAGRSLLTFGLSNTTRSAREEVRNDN